MAPTFPPFSSRLNMSIVPMFPSWSRLLPLVIVPPFINVPGRSERGSNTWIWVCSSRC